VQELPLLVEAGFGCSLSVASNGFVRTKLYLLLLKKNNAPPMNRDYCLYSSSGEL
jgi:hypothetical protein